MATMEMAILNLLMPRHLQQPMLMVSTWITSFYSHWNDNNDDLWGAADALVIPTPPASKDLRDLMVFMRKQIHFLCYQKKAYLLNSIRKFAKDDMDIEF
ncbi:hypothetical protein RJ641_023791 [Dillenia turbinata]|uniref:FACT complex subunit n=1 Tax=Dillenia turbinata TaxID=194707 RepID=A0AAN8UJF0_9MAGN